MVKKLQNEEGVSGFRYRQNAPDSYLLIFYGIFPYNPETTYGGKAKIQIKTQCPGCAEVTGYDILSGKNVQVLKKGYG